MLGLADYLNPALLWLGLGALAPIIIHLAARSRPKPTPFPAVRFILASHRKSSAKFKLKQLLLLLLRCLLLGLFAVLVARPWVKGSASDVQRAKATVTAVILLDNSHSMGYRHSGTSSFERAKKLALATVDAFAEQESRVCLLLVGDAPEPVISDFQHAYDLGLLKDHIGSAGLANRGTNCTAAVKEGIRMLNTVSGVGKSVFLFTDMTERSWPESVPRGEGDDDITVYAVDVGAKDPKNPAVLSVIAPASATAGASFEVRARVDAVGSAGRQAELVVDGERQGRKPASAHQVGEISLIASVVKRAPEHWGRVSLTGRDDLPLDNSYYFSFRSTPAMNVLLVNGAPSGVRRRDELHYLRTALAPSGIVTGQAFKVSEISPGRLESAELGGVDVVALCNVAGISTAAWTKVRHFVWTGRGLMVFTGDNVVPANYDAVSRGQAALLPCALGAPVAPAKPIRLEPGKLKHPMLRVWRGGRNGNLAEAKFRTYLKLKPNDEVAQEVVLAFKNDDPAVIAGRYGSGRVLVFASTCDVDWNDLPIVFPVYPILMHESVNFLAASREEQRDVRVGLAPALRISDPETVASVKMTRLGGETREPTGDTDKGLEDRLDRRSGRLNLPPVDQPGVYRLEIGRVGGRGADEMFFTANLDTAESNIERLAGGDERLRSLLSGRPVKIARTEAELLDQISRSESFAELSSHFAGIMLAILIAEMYLSNRMRTRVDTPEPAG